MEDAALAVHRASEDALCPALSSTRSEHAPAAPAHRPCVGLAERESAILLFAHIRRRSSLIPLAIVSQAFLTHLYSGDRRRSLKSGAPDRAHARAGLKAMARKINRLNARAV